MLKKVDKIFQEITGARLQNVSQLKLFDILKDIEDNEFLLNIFKSYTISDNVNASVHFELHEIDNNEWWDDISFKYYGTPNLWWVIALMNDVINPFEYLEEGRVLQILKLDYIYQLLKEIKNVGDL